MLRRITAAALAAAVLATLPTAATVAETKADSKSPKAERPPNVILIFTDDQGYGDIGCYGAKGFKTPNLDRMAKEGMRFTDFYVNCPVCSGSRTALMTGCHYQRLSMAAVLFPRSSKGLHPDETTVAEVLKSQGYATACIGKWHLGHLPPCLPTNQGFDHYYGVPYSNDMWIDKANKLSSDIKLREGVTVADIKAGKTKRNDVPLRPTRTHSPAATPKRRSRSSKRTKTGRSSSTCHTRSRTCRCMYTPSSPGEPRASSATLWRRSTGRSARCLRRSKNTASTTRRS